MKLQDVKKASLNNWHSRPPVPIQNIGDGLIGASMFALGYAAITGTQWLAVIFIVVGCAGIILQKLYKDD